MKQIKTFKLGLPLFIASFLFLSCSKSNSDLVENTDGRVHSTEAEIDHRVYMKNSTFFPATMALTAGKAVRWINDDNVVHTVTADDASFDSGDLQPGASYTRAFLTFGTFPYHCKYHKGMTGKVIAGGIR